MGYLNLAGLQRYTQKILIAMYPIGAIYISTEPTSPAELFGGSWERVKDAFLLAAGDTYGAGAAGGAATHKLTIDEMPKHRFTTGPYATSVGSGNNYYATVQAPVVYGTGYTNYLGADKPFDILPPYLTVYVWKRVA